MLERLKSKHIFALLLILLGVLILVGSLGYGFYSYRLTNPESAPLPQSLAGLPLNIHIYGKDAVNDINQLHGLAFPLSSGAVGIYGDQKQATLWISGTSSKSMAAKLTANMVMRIAEGNSPYTPIGESTDRNRTIFALEGHEQKHFYFQSGNLVVWLAANTEIAENALTETLVFYP